MDRALLHHVGREAPLYLPDGEDMVIVASYGGAPEGLVPRASAPRAGARRGRSRAAARRTAASRSASTSGPRSWDLYPAYADYQARTERTIRLVRPEVPRLGAVAPQRSWALTHSSATIAEPSDSSPHSTVAATISASLRTLPVP